MQNLRDKLLKAGKINKKQKKRADHNQRQQRRKKKKGPQQNPELQRQQAYEAQLEAKRAKDRELEEIRRQERAHKETELRIQYIVDHYSIRMKKGNHRWYYVARSGKILYFPLHPSIAAGLEYGRYSIVERPRAKDEDHAHAIVSRDAADMIWGIDTECVRFLNRKDPARPLRSWEAGEDEVMP